MGKDTIMISVYGSTGFVGKRFLDLYPNDTISIRRDDPHSKSNDVLYLISTTDNYNVFDKPYLDIETNLLKLISVLEAYRKEGRNGIFNFVSSWFVYGMASTLNTKETEICDPRGFYSISKRTAEQMLICYCETYDIKYRILRLTNIIGEGDMKVSAKKNAIQYMIQKLIKNEEVKLYENGNCTRDFMYVDDSCIAMKRCLDYAPINEIINISNSNPTLIGDIIRYAKNRINSSSETISIETPKFHKLVQVKDICLNNEKLISYGYKQNIPLYNGFDRIIDNLLKGN